VVHLQAPLTRRLLLLSALAASTVTFVRSDAPPAGPLPLVRRATFGAYADNEPWPDVQAHYRLEEQLGTRLPIMSWFQDWGPGWLHEQAAAAAATGHALLVAWDPSRDSHPIPFADIAAGHYDDYIRDFFVAAHRYPRKVVVRPFWEMNGNWGSYSVATAPDRRAATSVAEWRNVWKRLVNLRNDSGADSVELMFCANGTDIGGIPAEAYWPGATYVDRVGIDIYNGPPGPWRTPEQLIEPMYHRLTNLHPTAPVAIAELGCHEAAPGAPHSKTQWLHQLFSTRQFPRLTSITFFHARRDQDWRIDSSNAGLRTCREYLRSASPQTR
jgi:glycosyl hydrolase family 26